MPNLRTHKLDRLRLSIAGFPSKAQAWYAVVAYLTLSLLLAGCRAAAITPPMPSPVLPPPLEFAHAPAAVALPALVLAERQAAIDGDLALLAQLWAEDARIVDGRATPAPEDDYVWNGRPAILDRYLLAVFPNPPPALPADALAGAPIQTQGDQATLHHGIDRWRFIYRDGRWWLYELIYNQ